MIYVGCAGWAIRREQGHFFPGEGTHLERYSATFDCVEINSCFYKSHKPQTYEKWSLAVPKSFMFSVKLERTITHEQGLRHCDGLLEKFLHEVTKLGPHLGPILVQMPPKLQFEPATATAFFSKFRSLYQGPIVCEPRHRTWFKPDVKKRLLDWQLGLVAADPTIDPDGLNPAGDLSVCYYRLHGSPKIYESTYEESYLKEFADELKIKQQLRPQDDFWCIFDNTALGHATANAVSLKGLIESRAYAYRKSTPQEKDSANLFY